MTAPARFSQSDLERIFKAAKKAGVRASIRLKPSGEIEAEMLTGDAGIETDWRDGSPLYGDDGGQA